MLIITGRACFARFGIANTLSELRSLPAANMRGMRMRGEAPQGAGSLRCAQVSPLPKENILPICNALPAGFRSYRHGLRAAGFRSLAVGSTDPPVDGGHAVGGQEGVGL